MNTVLWDLNQSMGSFGMINTGGPPGGNLAELDLMLRDGDNTWPLIKLVLDNPTYRKMYIAHCKTIYEEQIANDLYYEQAVNLHNTMSADLQTDGNAIYSVSQALTNLTSTVSGGGPGPGFIGLKQLFDDRKTYLENTSEFQAVAPSIAEINFN